MLYTFFHLEERLLEYLLQLPRYFGVGSQLNGVLDPSKVPQYWEAWVLVLREFLLRTLLDIFSQLAVLIHQMLHKFVAKNSGNDFRMVSFFFQTILWHCVDENFLEHILTYVSCRILTMFRYQLYLMFSLATVFAPMGYVKCVPMSLSAMYGLSEILA